LSFLSCCRPGCLVSRVTVRATTDIRMAVGNDDGGADRGRRRREKPA